MIPQLELVGEESGKIELRDVTFKDNAWRDITRAVIEFVAPVRIQILKNGVDKLLESNPLVKETLVLEARDFGLKDFPSDYYQLNYYLLKAPFNLNIPAGDNVIVTNNGYLLSADFLFIGNRIYEVDKCHTGSNTVTLTEPVKFADASVSVAYKGSFHLPLKAEALRKLKDRYFANNCVCGSQETSEIFECLTLLEAILPHTKDEKKIRNIYNLVRRRLQ